MLVEEPRGGPQRATESLAGFDILIGRAQGGPQMGAHLRVLGSDLGRPAQGRHGFVGASGLQESQAEVEVGLDRRRVEVHGGPKLAQGLRRLPEADESHAEARVKARLPRLQPNRLAKGRGRLAVSPDAVKGDAERVLVLGHRRIVPRGLLEGHRRIAGPARPQQRLSEDVVVVGLLGLEPGRLAKSREGFLVRHDLVRRGAVDRGEAVGRERGCGGTLPRRGQVHNAILGRGTRGPLESLGSCQVASRIRSSCP
jgi:hypothetical protein